MGKWGMRTDTPSALAVLRTRASMVRYCGVGDEIGLAVALARGHGQKKDVDQVVDVEGVVQGLPAPEHGKGPGRDALEDHEEPLRVSGAVNGGRPQHDRGHPLGVIPLHQGFGLVFGPLVVIRRFDGGGLVRRRPVDVAVNAAGAAIDELFHPRPVGRGQHIGRAPGR